MIAVIIILAFIFVTKRRNSNDKKPGSGKKHHRQSSKKRPKSSYYDIETDADNRPVPVKEFPTHVTELHKDTNYLFAQEYEILQDKSENKPSEAANMAENVCKNRYTNILPYDHSRVKLLPSEDEEGSDYINANYIPGFNHKREFIAAQGPLDCTIDDFWRMIWEQQVPIVVMLTKEKEKEKKKCARYWPDDNDPVFYGDILVQRRSESVLGDYIIRVLDVKSKDIKRTIKQIHYINWPDFGCPDKTKDLLNLVQVVRNEFRPDFKGPVVIHCSAGVGRSGTFITVDWLLQRIKQQDTVDVFGTVLELRKYRCLMVQTEDQYIYIHDCLSDAIKKGLHLGAANIIFDNPEYSDNIAAVENGHVPQDDDDQSSKRNSQHSSQRNSHRSSQNIPDGFDPIPDEENAL